MIVFLLFCCVAKCSSLFDALSFLPSPDGASTSLWEQGAISAEAQNFARKLMDTPANLMTPSLFVDAVSAQLGEVPGVGRSRLEVIPRLVVLSAKLEIS